MALNHIENKKETVEKKEKIMVYKYSHKYYVYPGKKEIFVILADLGQI